MKIYKSTVCWLLLGWIALFLTGCASPKASKQQPISDTGFFLDTVVTITLYGVQEDTLIQNCFSRIREYENMLSRTREGSDIWKINHSQGTPTEVSEDTLALLHTALHYGELSGGAFDITIAPVTDLWEFGSNETGRLPDPARLEEALSHVDDRKIVLDHNTVTLTDPEAALDLGGIAKGYIADRLKDYLLEEGSAHGLTGGLIDLGGNLLAFGTKPGNTRWKLGIRKPFADTASELSAVVSVDNASLVTSGVYERYFKQDEQLFHHILNKETGYPADTGLVSVSVLSSSSADCDALSTVCFLLGADDGLALIESLKDTEALFITEEGTLLRSSGFPTE